MQTIPLQEDYCLKNLLLTVRIIIAYLVIMFGTW